MPARYLELTRLGGNEDLTQIVSVCIALGICMATAVSVLSRLGELQQPEIPIFRHGLPRLHLGPYAERDVD